MHELWGDLMMVLTLAESSHTPQETAMGLQDPATTLSFLDSGEIFSVSQRFSACYCWCFSSAIPAALLQPSLLVPVYVESSIITD